MATKKINFPLVFTQVADNVMFYSTFAAFFYFMSNENFTPLKAYISFNTLMIVVNLHDLLYRKLFPNVLAKVKTETPYTWMDLYHVVRVMSIVYGLAMVVLAYCGVLHFEYKGFLQTTIKVMFEYWVISFCKDFTTMKFIHPLLHTPKYYYLHELHHSVSKNLHIGNALHIDIIDVLIEHLVGIVFAIGLNYVLYGTPSVHMASFLYIMWTDIVNHSLNPYSASYANPVLDYLMKPCIEHNLHHVLQTEYYMFNSFEHLLTKGRLAKDLSKYNQIFDTKISYDLYI